jgi:hypothetical protein
MKDGRRVFGGFMIKQRSIGFFAAFIIFSMCIVHVEKSFAQDQVLTVKELIAKHLAAIGTPEYLAKIKSRGVAGKAMVKFVQGASGTLSDGSFLCVSEGKNLGMKIAFNDINYPGEHFAYNGIETSVKDVAPGRKSPLADFIFTYDSILKHGYLGGILSLSWPLLDYKEGQLEFQLVKEKIKDLEFYVLQTNMKDVKIRLFFDTKTFRHMRTEYLVRHKENVAANSSIVNTDTSLSEQAPSSAPATRMSDRTPRSSIREAEPDSIYKLVEKFDLYAAGSKEDPLFLPHSYGIELSLEGHGQSFLAQWSMVINVWTNNGKNIDKSFFMAQK